MQTAIDLLLTTHPAHKSQNVGDSLITSSAVRLMKGAVSGYRPHIVFREDCLDKYPPESVRFIFAPGFSVADQSYPNLYRLYTDIHRLPLFLPFGCSFQSTLPYPECFDQHKYCDASLRFFSFLVDRAGPLPCRDELIRQLLLRHGLPAFYSGDAGLYDVSFINRAFIPPRRVQTLVFTIQHHKKFFGQSIKLLERLKDCFPLARKYIAFHSKISTYSASVASVAQHLGFSPLHLYGDASQLRLYDDMDLHVGYRLHGHISFLRRRKPSVLLVEDARGFGFSRTSALSFGCIDAAMSDGTPADEAPEQATQLIDKQLSDSFRGYHKVFEFIDHSYTESVSPFFTSLAKRLQEQS